MNEIIENKLIDMFGICNCAEIDLVVKTLIRFLEWAESVERDDYNTLYKDAGIYYLIAGMCEKNDLIQHGVSIRCAFISPKGKEFLTLLKQYKETK